MKLKVNRTKVIERFNSYYIFLLLEIVQQIPENVFCYVCNWIKWKYAVQIALLTEQSQLVICSFTSQNGQFYGTFIPKAPTSALHPWWLIQRVTIIWTTEKRDTKRAIERERETRKYFITSFLGMTTFHPDCTVSEKAQMGERVRKAGWKIQKVYCGTPHPSPRLNIISTFVVVKGWYKRSRSAENKSHKQKDRGRYEGGNLAARK